jgi:hypothetical protein
MLQEKLFDVEKQWGDVIMAHPYFLQSKPYLECKLICQDFWRVGLTSFAKGGGSQACIKTSPHVLIKCVCVDSIMCG